MGQHGRAMKLIVLPAATNKETELFRQPGTTLGIGSVIPQRGGILPPFTHEEAVVLIELIVLVVNPKCSLNFLACQDRPLKQYLKCSFSDTAGSSSPAVVLSVHLLPVSAPAQIWTPIGQRQYIGTAQVAIADAI